MPTLEAHGVRRLLKHVDRNDWKNGAMHTIVRTGRSERWLPKWSNDDRKIRLVVYESLWRYAAQSRTTHSSYARPGMSVRELEKIAAEIRDNLEISASRTKVDHAKRSIANHIQSTERGYATRLTVIIYRCYRQRQHSHDVAEDLGMTPGAVRQALHRANLIARRLFPELCSEDHWSVKPEDERKRNKRIQRYKNGVAADDPWPELLFIAALYNSGVTLRELGENFGKSHCSIHVWLKRYGLIEPSRKNSSQFCEGPYTRQRNGDVQPSLV